MVEVELIGILRILLAGICGGIVGIERKNRSKEAGIRTHFVVASGAALIMIVSKYAFFDIGEIAGLVGFGGEIKVDPSRVASTIASGIGFLGAGMIFVHKNTITGLTTAAGIWMTSGIGMAIGAGLYITGIIATFAILIGQVLLHIDFHRSRCSRMKLLNVRNVDEEMFQKNIMGYLESKKIRVHSTAVECDDDNLRNYTFVLELPNEAYEDEILTYVKHKSSIKPCN